MIFDILLVRAILLLTLLDYYLNLLLLLFLKHASFKVFFIFINLQSIIFPRIFSALIPIFSVAAHSNYLPFWNISKYFLQMDSMTILEWSKEFALLSVKAKLWTTFNVKVWTQTIRDSGSTSMLSLTYYKNSAKRSP